MQRDRSGLISWNESYIEQRVVRSLSPPAKYGETVADYNDPNSILRYVLDELAGTLAVIYPSERYFYYRFPLGERFISGNIRFSNVEHGEISVGYFDEYNQHDFNVGTYVDGSDGVSIDFDDAAGMISLEFEGKISRFQLDRRAFEQPNFDLFKGERHISGLLDESGYFLHLMYWPSDRALYYVLNDTKALPEILHRAVTPRGHEVWFGEDSRFCFYKHPRSGRMILVGVATRNIQENNWFDGPFDQVPPYLPIGDIIRTAYPYVEDAGGIDDHGNFLKRDGTRIAISPYQKYTSGTELLVYLDTAIRDDKDSPLVWTQATYEYKKDWRAPGTGSERPPSHSLDRSATWPPNHFGRISRSWKEDHQQAASVQREPNSPPAQ
ncbi:MAG: hypothetical protein AAFR76_03645 [Planctomycetota bacterium]